MVANENLVTKGQPRSERLGISLTKDQKRTLRRASKKLRCSMADLLQPEIDEKIEAIAVAYPEKRT